MCRHASLSDRLAGRLTALLSGRLAAETSPLLIFSPESCEPRFSSCLLGWQASALVFAPAASSGGGVDEGASPLLLLNDHNQFAFFSCAGAPYPMLPRMPCRAVLSCAVLVLCHAVRSGAVLCCVVFRYAVLCGAVMSFAVMCIAVLCCAARCGLSLNPPCRSLVTEGLKAWGYGALLIIWSLV